MSEDRKTLERLRVELDEWRSRLEPLRLQASLGRMEARDRLREVEERLDPALARARSVLDELVERGTDEVRTLGKSLLAGWEEVRRTHRRLSETARERADDEPGDGTGGRRRMKQEQEREDRKHEIRRIFEEHGFGDLALLEGWDGRELEDLAGSLTEEEYQTLLDELAARDER